MCDRLHILNSHRHSNQLIELLYNIAWGKQILIQTLFASFLLFAIDPNGHLLVIKGQETHDPDTFGVGSAIVPYNIFDDLAIGQLHVKVVRPPLARYQSKCATSIESKIQTLYGQIEVVCEGVKRSN